MPTVPCAGVRGCLARTAAILLALLAAGADAQARVFVADAPERVVAERSAGPGQFVRQAIGGTPRLRVARADYKRLAAAREGVEQGQPARARLNLFEDAESDWIVERATPTATGYSLSGPLAGVESGTATLVVNGGTVVGSAWTPEASYRIRTVGRAQIVERADASLARACEGALRRVASTSEALAAGDSSMADDGSEIDVLVVYTPQARRRAGGHRPMLAEIDHDVAWTNAAYAVSDVVHRVRLVGAVETDHLQQGGLDDLNHLIKPDDGRMDEVHALRDSLAADVVVLKTTDGGIAVGLLSLDRPLSPYAFATAAVGGLTTFAHELGHVMGIHHDRGASDSNGNRPFPYSHGYVLAGIRDSEGHEYSTIMQAAGGNLPRFSNPRQRFRGVPLGVPGDEPTGRLDGPADGARSMNETRLLVANYRKSSTRCQLRLAGTAREIDAAGGPYTLRVEADAGCAWAARSTDGFATIASGARGSGDGVVTYEVLPNEGWEREVAVAVAGRMHVAVQPGSRPVKPACERSESIRDAIEAELNAPCADVSAAELLQITKMVLADAAPVPGDFDGLTNLGDLLLHLRTGTTLAAGTFDGLAGVASLRIRGVAYSLQPGSFHGLEHLRYLSVGSSLTDETAILPPLPAGTFDGLPRLRELSYFEGARHAMTPGLFRGLSELARLTVFGEMAHLPAGMFRGLPNLRRLTVNSSTGSSPVTLAAGVFDGLQNLERLELDSLADVRPRLFAGLSRLRFLSLRHNAFTSLPPGAFDGLSSLHTLVVANDDPFYAHSVHQNELSTLPPGLFRGLPSLFTLALPGAGLTKLRPAAFEDVGATLHVLDLNRNRLSVVDAGTFDGLPHLVVLDLSDNLLTSLPAGTLDHLPRLAQLFLGGNRLAALPAGMFESVCRLGRLELHGNRLTALPPSLFVCQNDEWLYSDNRRLATPNVWILTLHGNPGAPFAFDVQPYVASPPWQRPIRVAVRMPQGAPYSLDVSLEAEGGAIEADSLTIAARAPSSDSPSSDVDMNGRPIGPVARTLAVTPTGRERVAVRIAGIPDAPGAECAAFVDEGKWCGRGTYYTGIELAAGEPLVLNGVAQRRDFDEPAEIDLANVFLEFDGAAAATFTVRSSDPAVAVAAIAGDVLRVVPVGDGTATITVMATAADGRTATRTFAVTAPAQSRFLRGWRLALLNEGEDPP